MKIYSIPSCPFCMRAKLAVKQKQLKNHQIEIVEIDLNNPPNNLLKINPMGAVPTLEIKEGSGFAESMTIVEFVDNLEGEGSHIYSIDPEENAKEKFLIEMLNNKVLQKILKIFSVKNDYFERIQISNYIPQAMAELNTLIKTYPNKFQGEKNLNAIDIFLAPFLSYYSFACTVQSFIPKVDEKLSPLAFQYIKKLENHPIIKSVFPEEKVFQEVIHSYTDVPENILEIKNSSRQLIDNIDDQVKQLNQNIAQFHKDQPPVEWKKNSNDKGFYIETTFNFKNYDHALKTIRSLCNLQEYANHHCHFLLDNFTQLKVEICTHQPKWGVTPMDIKFAEALSKLIIN